MNTKEQYCLILSLRDMPKTPQELPGNIYLPNGALGDLEEAIFKTTQYRAEYDQKIFWKNNSYRKGDFHKGDATSANVPSLRERLGLYFFPKPLLDYHTHTTDHHEADSYEPSSSDVAVARGCPREGYVRLCGSRQGISALLQTRQSAKLPWQEDRTIKRIERELDETDFELKPQYEQAKALEDLGFGYYIWLPQKKNIQRHDLQQGIHLQRITR